MTRIVVPILALVLSCLALPASAIGVAATASTPTPSTGMIVGRVTDQDTGGPVSSVYITVGYKGIKLAAITGADGRYTVPNVPASQAADVFGFHGGGFRYHNSIYDDHLHIMVKPGQTYTYNFTVRQLHDPAGEPQVTGATMTPNRGAAGQTITFEVTASDGKGGLSDEVMAASPKLERLALLTKIGGDRYRGTLTIPPGTAPGDYPFAFFAASNDCYDNHVFPILTLHVG